MCFLLCFLIMAGQYEPPITLDQVLDRASIGLPVSAPPCPSPVGGGQAGQPPGGGDDGAADSNGQGDLDAQALPAGAPHRPHSESGGIAIVDIPGGGHDCGLAESWGREADQCQTSVGVVLDHVVQPVCIRAAAGPQDVTQDPAAISVLVDDGRDAAVTGAQGRAEPASASREAGGEAVHLSAGEAGGGGADAQEQLPSAGGSPVKITTFLIT